MPPPIIRATDIRPRMIACLLRGIFQNAAGFAAIFVALWLGVDVGLIYHGGGVIPDFPVFYWGWDFARESLAQPGGAADYLSSLLMQSLFLPWFGALSLTLQSGIIYVSARRCVKALDLPSPDLLGFIAPLLFFGIYLRYGHEAQAVMDLTLALAALGLFTLLPADRPGIRWAGLVLGLALLYPVAASAEAVFAIMAALLEWRRSGEWQMSVGALALGVALSLAEGWWIFGLAPEEVFASLWPVTQIHLMKHPFGLVPFGTLYCLLPMLGMGALARDAWHKWRSRKMCADTQEKPVSQPKTGPAQSKKLRRESRKAGKTQSRGARGFDWAWCGGWIAQTVLTCAVAVGVYFAVHDQRLKTVLAVDYYACHEMWPNVLEETAMHPLHDPFVACTSAQAAFHQGRLTRQLPELARPDDLLLAGREGFEDWKMSGIYLDLGFVNLAMHSLAESVEKWGERPLLLRRLVIANLAIGNVSTARIYLNALTKVPFHTQWARDYLRRLEADPSLNTDMEITRLRKLMVKRDLVGSLATDEIFGLLLDACPQNRMAFEYRMTYRLLTKNLPGFAKSLKRVHDFPGFEVPPLWEEAFIIYSREQGMPASEIKARFNPDLVRRLDQILQAYEANGHDATATWNQFKSEYADSYFLYYLCHP
jgi:hypothetical protein